MISFFVALGSKSGSFSANELFPHVVSWAHCYSSGLITDSPGRSLGREGPAVTEAGVTLRGWGGAARREGPAWGRGSGSRWAGAAAESTKGEESWGDLTGEPQGASKPGPRAKNTPREARGRSSESVLCPGSAEGFNSR